MNFTQIISTFKGLSTRKLIACLAILFVFLAACFTMLDWRTSTIRGDFTLFSLEASRVLYSGGDPYSRAEVGRNYKYQPVNAVLLWPFTLLPIPVAQGIWTTINLYLLIGTLFLQWRLLDRMRLPWWIIIPLLIFGFRMIHGNLKMGQWNTSVYCLGVIGTILLFRGMTRRGAILIGLGASLKFLPALLLIPFLLTGRLRACVLSLAALGFWSVVVPVTILGPTRFVELYDAFDDKAGKVLRQQTGRYDERVGVSLNALVYLAMTPAIREDISPEGGMNLLSRSAAAGRNTALGVSAFIFVLAGIVT